MWESEVDGKKLTFHLAGINNQNFIMRDEETGTWWQQVSGEAIHGPLKGKKLTRVDNDELTFAIWKRENRQGRVLKPDERVKQKYEAADWEEQYAKFRVVTPVDPNDKLSPRTLIAGLARQRQVGGVSAARSGKATTDHRQHRLRRRRNAHIHRVGGRQQIRPRL